MDKAIKNVKKTMDKKMDKLVSMDKKMDKKCEMREKMDKGEKHGSAKSHGSSKKKRKKER